MFNFSALTPMEYVSQYVHVCPSSVQLYRRVFNLHREGAAPGTPAPAPALEALQQDGHPAEQPAEQSAADPVDIASLDEEPRYMLGEVNA